MSELICDVYIVDAVGDVTVENYNTAVSIVDTNKGEVTFDIEDPKKKGQNICIKVNHLDLMYALGQMRNKDL